MSMSQRVFITGFGIITSIGKNAEENFQSLVTGKYGFGSLEVLDTVHRDSLSACEIKLEDQELSDAGRCTVARRVYTHFPIGFDFTARSYSKCSPLA